MVSTPSSDSPTVSRLLRVRVQMEVWVVLHYSRCWILYSVFYPCLEIILHDLPQHRHLLKIPGAHRRSATGICFAGPSRLLSCGVDQTVKLWDVQTSSDADGMEVDEDGEVVVQVRFRLNYCLFVFFNFSYMYRREPLPLSTRAKPHSSMHSCYVMTLVPIINFGIVL